MTDVTNVTSGQQQDNTVRPTSSNEDVTQAENTEFNAVEPSDETNANTTGDAVARPGSGESDEDPFERAAAALEGLLPDADELANTRLRILLDDDSGRFIYQSIDSESGEVVRQFPPEEILELINNFRAVEGLAVDRDA